MRRAAQARRNRVVTDQSVSVSLRTLYAHIVGANYQVRADSVDTLGKPTDPRLNAINDEHREGGAVWRLSACVHFQLEVGLKHRR